MCKGDIKLYSKQCDLLHSSVYIHLSDKVSLTFRTQNNGVKNSTLTQWWTGKNLCPVQIWADIIIIL